MLIFNVLPSYTFQRKDLHLSRSYIIRLECISSSFYFTSTISMKGQT